MPDPVAILLAAGKSTRMKSDVPKVLHEICGRPMIEYVLDAARAAGVRRIVAVIGHQAELVRQALAAQGDVEFALQTEQKGTGHAVMMCAEALAGHDGPVLVLAGDTPLLRSESLTGLLDDLRRNEAACVIGTAVTEVNQGLGRVVRDGRGNFMRIVEQKDATAEEAAIREINTGCYAFGGRELFDSLRRVQPNNRQGEYYLTDCPAILLADGKRVIASPQFDIVEAMGVNTRVQLAEVEQVLQSRNMERLMLDGVTIVSPAQTWIDPRSRIGRDTMIHPFTSIRGAAVIGSACRIGPNAVVEGPCEIPDGTVVEPFQRIMPGE